MDSSTSLQEERKKGEKEKVHLKTTNEIREKKRKKRAELAGCIPGKDGGRNILRVLEQKEEKKKKTALLVSHDSVHKRDHQRGN